MHSIAGAIILSARTNRSDGSGGVPGLMYAWRLSQAVIMATQFSHEIDASRLKLTAKVRLGNPTDNNLKISYPIIRYFHNNKLLFTSSETDQNLNLNKGDEICFDTVNTQILRQSHPDLFTEYTAKEKVIITVEIKTIINEKIPCIRTMIIGI